MASSKGSFCGCFFLSEELTAYFQGQRKGHHCRSRVAWNHQALKKVRKRLGRSFSVTFYPLTGCWGMVAMAADPLGASDRHFPEVTPDFLSEGKEMVPQHR